MTLPAFLAEFRRGPAREYALSGALTYCLHAALQWPSSGVPGEPGLPHAHDAMRLARDERSLFAKSGSREQSSTGESSFASPAPWSGPAATTRGEVGAFPVSHGSS